MMKAPKPPPPPEQPAAVRIPSPEDADLIEARRTKMKAEFANRQGRQSTQLAGVDGGGQAYTRTTLG